MSDVLSGAAGGRTEIEEWIASDLSPVHSTAAELTYERMEFQSGRKLPVIYEPLDHRNRSHWHDVAIVSAFAHALGGASRVLDVGPGDGWPSLRIADRFERIVGIDPSPRRVSVQRENAARLGIANVEFLEMDAVSLAFESESFGGVTAASSIEQSEDPRKALAEVFRVLEPGGALAMVFEDYGVYFPESDGDEELWTESGQGDPVLFYQRRTKSPACEAKYGLFLDGKRLEANPELAGRIEALKQDTVRLESFSHGEPAPTRPESLGVAFFESLAPLVTRTEYFELARLTSESLDDVLSETGFVDVGHLDRRMGGVLEFFDAAREEGRLGDLGPVFETVSEVFGIAAVRRAGPGPGDFVIARKPPGG